MSTHNPLLNIGDSCFLELIAIDPAAPAPSRKRWIGLDDPTLIARLADSPRGVGWVVRTDTLERVVAGSPVQLGAPKAMSRGTRSWRLTVPDAGGMPYAGLVPAFIEWSPGPHLPNRCSSSGRSWTASRCGIRRPTSFATCCRR